MNDTFLEMVATDRTKDTEEAISNIDKDNQITVTKNNTELNIDEIDANDKIRDELPQCVVNVDDLKKENDERIKNREYTVFGYYGGGNQANPPVTIVQLMGTGGKNYQPTDGEPLNYDPSTRNSFVKLVFSIVLIMLLATAGFNVLVFIIDDLTHIFQQYNLIILIPAMILMISLSYAVTCSKCARVIPCNIIVLILTVIAMSVMSTCITVMYRTELIFYAFIATSVVVMICLALACTSFDFTRFLLFLIVIMGVVAAISLIILIVKLTTGVYMKPIQMVILFVGALVQSVMLIIELQMILGGKTIELSESDYALGAFMLYTSIMDLFIKLLLIIAGIDSD